MDTITIIEKPRLDVSVYYRTTEDAPFYGLYTRRKRRGTNWNLWRLSVVCDKFSLESAIDSIGVMFDNPVELNVQASQTLDMPNKFMD